MNQLPRPFHLAPQLAQRRRVAEQRLRHKMERHVLAQHLIVREPDFGFAGSGEALFQAVAARQFLAGGKTGGLGGVIHWGVGFVGVHG